MRSIFISLLSLATIVAADRSTPHLGRPGLPPNGVCASTDDYEQCLALVDLYSTTNGDGWKSNTGWLSGSSYCGWFGVTCDSSGNMTQL